MLHLKNVLDLEDILRTSHRRWRHRLAGELVEDHKLQKRLIEGIGNIQGRRQAKFIENGVNLTNHRVGIQELRNQLETQDFQMNMPERKTDFASRLEHRWNSATLVCLRLETVCRLQQALTDVLLDAEEVTDSGIDCRHI